MHDTLRRSREEPSPRPRPSEPKPIRWVRAGAVAGFALLCPLVGTADWGKPLCLIALACLFWLQPPQRSLPTPFNVVFALLLGLAAFAFLPASWFSLPEWRAEAASVGLSLPGTLSPQPWLTLDEFIVFAAGLAWLYYLAVQRWNTDELRALTRIYLGGLLVLVALALVFHLSGASIPFWKSERNFGPFANRNNTANLLAFGGLMMMACSYDELSRSKWKAAFWTAAAMVVLFGLVFSYSRSGILLFFFGLSAWLGIMAVSDREKVRLGVVMLAALFLGMLFLTQGGGLLERFTREKSVLVAFARDSRWPLHQETLALGAANPWPGLGLGNFADVFPRFRRESLSERRALHPDGDWVWLRAEMGWLGVVLVLAGAGLFTAHILPLRHGTNQRLRSAAAMAALGFAIHGFINVSGHTLGTMVPALFLLGLALNPSRKLETARWLAMASSAAGLIFAVFGVMWLVGTLQLRPVPGKVGAANLKQAAKAFYAQQKFHRMIPLTTQGLSFAPLDWEFYNLRGLALALARGDWQSAQSDFRRARFLNANAARLPYQQGLCLLNIHPPAAVEPFREALRRGGDDAPRLFRDLLDFSARSPEHLQAIKTLAHEDLDRCVAFLARLTGTEFTKELEWLRLHDPDLVRMSEAQRATVLGLWILRGDKDLLVQELATKPAWHKAAWQWLAKRYAEEKRFEEAYLLAKKFSPPARLPTISSQAPISDLEKRFVLNKSNFAHGYQLQAAQAEAGKRAQALHTIRALTALPNSPSYFFSREAELHAELGNWEQAWHALQRYEPQIR